jgi:hypothetical protein
MVTDELDAVIGVDTHRDIHAAALVRPTGAVVSQTQIDTTGEGYQHCSTSPSPRVHGWCGRWKAPAATASD